MFWGKPVGRLSANSRPTDGRQSADSRPTVVRQVFWGALLHTQIKTCLETFNEHDLGINVHIFKESVCKQIKGSFQAFKPPTDPLKILLNVSLNCGSRFETESKFWLQKINYRLTGKPRNLHNCAFFFIMEYGIRQDFLFTIENSYKLQ